MKDSLYLLTKYPSRVPVIISKRKNDNIDDLDKSNYLLLKDMHFWQFVCVLRKKLNLPASSALFILTSDGSLVSNVQTISQIYQNHKSFDGFLRLTYASENAFG